MKGQTRSNMVKIIYLYVISISDDHHLVVTLPVGSESISGQISLKLATFETGSWITANRKYYKIFCQNVLFRHSIMLLLH